MANTITLKTSDYNGRYLQLVCTQQTNIEENYSTITWVLSSVGGSSNYYDTGPTTVKINNEQVWYKARVVWSSYAFPAKKGSTSGTYTVYHDEEGKASIPVFLETAIYSSTKRTATATWELDTIPRGAKLVSVPQNFNDEENPTITFSNPIGNTADKLEICIVTESDGSFIIPYKEITNKTATTYTFNFTDAERDAMRKAMKDVYGIDVRFYIRTTIGGKMYLNSLPSWMGVVNANPNVWVISLEDTNPKTLALTKDADTIVYGHNTIAILLDCEAYKYSSINRCVIVCGDQSINATIVDDNTIEATLYNVTDSEFDITVYDTRGFSQNITWTLNGLEYVDITCNQEVSIELVGEQEANVHLTVKGSYYNGDFENSDNDYFFYYRYSENEGPYTDWIESNYASTDINEDNTYVDRITVSGLNYNSTYDFQCKAADMLTDATTTPYRVKLVPVFDWSENDFNFNVPVMVQGVPIAANTILWEGAALMGAGNTATLTAPISSQPHGIILVFTGFINNNPVDYYISSHVVPKALVEALPGAPHTFFMCGDAAMAYVGAKYLYINDTTITGHANNEATGTGVVSTIAYNNNRWVLRYVIGF